MNRQRRRRALLAFAVLMLIALFVVRPGANGLRKRIVNSVSLALGRKVDVQWVKLQLLPQPGFNLVNFVVRDDPAFSAEPVLRAQEVTAVLRLRSLLRGRLEIGRLSLKEPSFNLVRGQTGHWNVESLIERAARTEAAPTRNTLPERRPIFPYIEAENGRINFKLGLEKKSYSLTDADFALWLESDNQWGMRLAGQPVRTDFNLTDTGTLRVDGTWTRSGSLSQTPLKFTFDWDGAQLGELTKLLYGKDMGWRGALLISAALAGTPADLHIELKSSLENFRRYDIVAQRSMHLATSCQALYSSIDRAISNVACTSPVGEGRITLRGRLQAPTGPRTYDLAFALEHVPIQSVAELARRSKKNLPDDVSASGTIDGFFRLEGSPSSREGVHWSGSGRTNGFILKSVAAKTELAFGTIPFTAETMDAAVQKRTGVAAASGTRLTVGPFPIALAKGSSATVTGWAASSGYHLGIQGDSPVQRFLQLAELSGFQGPRITAEGDTRFNLVVAGDWHGFAAPRPIGSALLKSVKTHLPGVNGIIDIRSASVTLDPETVQVSNLTASAAGANWQGSLSFPRLCHLLSGCPIHFDLFSDAIAAERLHASLSTGKYNRAWYRFSGLGNRIPSLLSAINAQGALGTNRLLIRGVTATHVSCQLQIRDGVVHLSELTAEMLGGKHRGEWTGNLAVSPPQFSGTGKFEHLNLAQLAEIMHDAWIAGTANGSYEISASGKTAREWLASSNGTVGFDMHDGSLPHVVIAAGAGPLAVRRFTGRMQLRDGSFQLDKGKLESASGSYEVSGTASPGEKVHMKLMRSGAGFVIDGTLTAPHVVPIKTPDTQAALKP